MTILYIIAAPLGFFYFVQLVEFAIVAGHNGIRTKKEFWSWLIPFRIIIVTFRNYYRNLK